MKEYVFVDLLQTLDAWQIAPHKAPHFGYALGVLHVDVNFERDHWI
jgi:hypothetical protein